MWNINIAWSDDLLQRRCNYVCKDNERKFFQLLNHRLRLYLWELSRGNITDSAGECPSVSAMNNLNNYCAMLNVTGLLPYDLGAVVNWLISAGASSFKIMSMLYDGTNENNGASIQKSSENAQWQVYFEVR